jgi:hypothetical protein
VAGPVIAALFLVTWQMFSDEYAPLDTSLPPQGDLDRTPIKEVI